MRKKLKFVVTVLLSVMAAGMQAQEIDNTFRFVDANGNPVANGSTINVSEITEDPFGEGFFISTGLSVENTTNAEAYLAAEVSVKSLPNGSFQVCFPQECISGVTGSFTTGNGNIAANAKKDLATEWIPAGEGQYGTATTAVKLKVMTRSGKFPNFKYAFKAYGPEVTVNCIYGDKTAISGVTADGTASFNVYDITGKTVVKGADNTVVQGLASGTYLLEAVKDGKRVGMKKVVK